MAVNLSPLAGAGWQFFSNEGNPLSGGLLYSYQAGTSTLTPTYTTASGNIANSNPIVLDAYGRPPQEVWLNNNYSYKFVLTDANFVLIGTWDNLSGLPSARVESSVTATQGQTVFTGLSYTTGNHSLSVFVNGSKQISGLNYNETNSTTITFIDGLNLGDVVEFLQ